MKRVRVYAKYMTVTIIVLISLIPFYSLLYLSLNSPSSSFFEGNVLLPDFQFSNYKNAWVSSRIGFAILNSLIITIGAVAIVVTFASSAGYSIARFNSRLNRWIFTTLLLCMMIPAIIITVPLYTLMKSIGGINTHWAMILLTASTALPLAVFLYTSFIKSLPREVEQSAVIDGCTYFGAFWRVTFYFISPVTAAVVILTGLGIWNNYAQAVFFLQSQTMQTVPLAVSMFFQTYGAQWNLMAAAAVIGLAPAVVVFLFFQKFFIKGIITGSLKG